MLHASLVESLKDAVAQFRRWIPSREVKVIFYEFEDGSKKPLCSIMEHIYTKERYGVVLKNDWYHEFGRHFPALEKGYGQAANLELLKRLEAAHISLLVAVMPRGVAYTVNVSQFLDYYHENKTNVPHLPGEVACPASMWTRLYPRQEGP